MSNEAVLEPVTCYATIPDLKEVGKKIFDTCDYCHKIVAAHPHHPPPPPAQSAAAPALAGN
jgi:cytochrome c2